MSINMSYEPNGDDGVTNSILDTYDIYSERNIKIRLGEEVCANIFRTWNQLSGMEKKMYTLSNNNEVQPSTSDAPSDIRNEQITPVRAKRNIIKNSETGSNWCRQAYCFVVGTNASKAERRSKTFRQSLTFEHNEECKTFPASVSFSTYR
ncbi:hypothetical protein PR048_019873, partial [Dryococelus australis]